MNPPSPQAPARRPLLTLDDALQRLAAIVADRSMAEHARSERVDTAHALGRVLARPVVSDIDVPRQDVSAMDGYAVRSAEIGAGTSLPVGLRVAAGQAPGVLPPGAVARIFTGAPVPEGADAVEIQEHVDASSGSDGGPRATFERAVAAGACIRRRGEDVQQGSVVLPAGERLTPQALGLAASVGLARLHVLPRPRVALLSTGDELAMPGEPLPPGAIYNSNRFLLRGLLEAAGCEVRDLGIVGDSLPATREALRRAAQADGEHAACDLILTTGGVSVGEADHVKAAVQAEGWLDQWALAIKPGKPLACGGVRRAGAPDDAPTPLREALFLGLPGNPVACFVTFLVVVAPVLRALQGRAMAGPPPVQVVADFDGHRPDARREFLRARWTQPGQVAVHPNQGSGVLTSAVWADGLLDVAPQRVIRRGDTVPMHLPALMLAA